MKTLLIQHPKVLLVILVTVALFGARAAYLYASVGPGMTIIYRSMYLEKKVDAVRTTTSNGIPFSGPGSLIPTCCAEPERGSSFSGAAPDGRQLPEWVEFEWQEWPYPSPRPEDPEGIKRWEQKVDELSKTLPHKTTRVQIRSRVPKDVVDEVIASKHRQRRDKLPDRELELQFNLYEDAVRLRWRLNSVDPDTLVTTTLRIGGDELPARARANP